MSKDRDIQYYLLLSIYVTMVRIRVFEEHIAELVANGEVVMPCHLYSGQEATATGICAALESQDYVWGGHRSHGHYLAKGGDSKALMAEIYGKATGCSRGRGGSMHLIDTDKGMLGGAPIVAGTISLALGSALAAKMRGEKRVAVSFFGDGATGEGVLYESLNFAALKKLPIIFVCENNYYSTHMSIAECRPNDNICEVADPFGIKKYSLDGNDVLEVFETTKSAVAGCRNGEGPVFLECLTYRQRGHVGPDDNVQGMHTDIRPKDEIERWMRNDPIKRYEEYLIKNGVLDEKTIETVSIDIENEFENAHRLAKLGPEPRAEELTNYVYSE